MARTPRNSNTPAKGKANPMWGGQFTSEPSKLLAEINASIDFDKALFEQDIAGSIAHAAMLGKQGILTSAEAKKIITGLESIRDDIRAGRFVFRRELEDIHMNVEAALKERIGDVAGKLHTARSRNDQVVTDFRLYVRDALDAVDSALAELQRALLKRAGEHAATIMPGFTHLQTAQPVTFGHHLLAYVEMFGRDRARARDARNRLNECPLGAAALAGTSFPIDRDMTADLLGFARPMANSLDAVSDRDFALEFLSLASICSVHLSRLSEELVLWSSTAFSFIRFSDAFSTGSSIMPQKRNPDAAELVRGKSGRVIGALSALLVVMKGLPLAYNKDMQEDKEPVFDAARSLLQSITVMRGMIDDVSVQEAAMRSAADAGHATATDLADYLVRVHRMAFREAHHAAAKIVALAEAQKKRLEQLSLKDMQKIAPQIREDVFDVLGAEASVASRTSFGGTASANVKKAVAAAKKRFAL